MFVGSNKKQDLKFNSECQTMCFYSLNDEKSTELENVDLLSRLCILICSREVKVRAVALQDMEICVEKWLDGYCSPTSRGPPPLSLVEKELLEENMKNGTQSNLLLVNHHVLTLLRLSVSCPFEDVRIKCRQILRAISEKGVLVPFHKVIQGPSYFIPPDDATYDKMTGEVLNELRDPTWILDRRNSGKLFWRRDSASASEKNRVKFRCDVEVVEYLRPEPEPPQYEDWSSDEDDERYGWRLRPWEQEIPPPNTFWGGVCMLVIAAVITYQWLAV